MAKKISLGLLGILLSIGFLTSCNEDPDDVTYTYSITKVTSFSLKNDKKILNNLDSVFFSIDLVNGRIFNADSLPYGTDVSKLVVNLTTESCSTIELHIPRKGDSDTIVNYIKNSTDSINFANGPVKLHLVSYDKKAERDYTIYVNVHKVEPDQLTWDRMALSTLPGNFPDATEQKTVKYGDNAACLIKHSGGYALAFNPRPTDIKGWEIQAIAFAFTPKVRSLTATDTALFILSTDNKLYRSANGGTSWNDTGITMTHIYGVYNNSVLGVDATGSQPLHVTYPATSSVAVPTNCPIEGTSALAYASSSWSNRQQCYFIGGTLANGSYSNATWGYDGSGWAMISNTLPVKATKMTMFDYKVSTTDTINWTTKEYPCLIAMGGLRENGAVNDIVFLSRDYGINWKTADELLQLPSYVPAMAGADAIILDTEMGLNSSEWILYANPLSIPGAKAVTPITEWDCPYIYLFGGYDSDGSLYNTIWRGVINRLKFRPLQ